MYIAVSLYQVKENINTGFEITKTYRKYHLLCPCRNETRFLRALSDLIGTLQFITRML